MSDALNPSVSLLCKIGSLAAHIKELHSSNGHEFDRKAIDTLIEDSEVCEWLDAMTDMALVPQMRPAQQRRDGG
jgi:vacuolar-type H+-ATPase subunit C/Vma6